jgi:hypothetical protein
MIDIPTTVMAGLVPAIQMHRPDVVTRSVSVQGCPATTAFMGGRDKPGHDIPR